MDKWWAFLGMAFLAIVFLGGFIYEGYKIRKQKKEFEEKERERRIEEELKANAEQEKAKTIAQKRNLVNYWMGEIERHYCYLACPTDIHVKSIFDDDPFCKVCYRQLWGCFSPYVISHYEYMGNRYEVFIPFKSTDGWEYALTIQKVAFMYVVDIIPLGNDQTNFNMPEEPSWKYPRIEIPEYMMDVPNDGNRFHWYIKENFEYFKPYGFKIAQEVDTNGAE